MDANSIEERLQQMQIEYIKKKRKLKKSRRSSDARLHVQQKLQEFRVNSSGDGLEIKNNENLAYDVNSMLSNSGKGDNEINIKGNNIESQDLFLSPEERVAKIESSESDEKLKVSVVNNEDTDKVTLDDDVVIVSSKNGETSNQHQKSLKLAKNKNKNVENISSFGVVANFCLIKQNNGQSMFSDRLIQPDISDERMNYKSTNIVPESVPSAGIAENSVKASNDIKNETPVLSEDILKPSLKNEIHFCGDLNFNTDKNGSSFSSLEDELFDESKTKKTSVGRRSSSRKRRLSGIEGQRKSSRIANSSSQSSTSSSQTSNLPPEVPLNQQCTRMRTHIILSSVFQCLVDEGKRQPEKEFHLDIDHSGVRKSDIDSTNTKVNVVSTDSKVNVVSTDSKVNVVSTDSKVNGNDSDDLFEPDNLSEQKEINSVSRDIDDKSKTTLVVSKVDNDDVNIADEVKVSQELNKVNELEELSNDNIESEEIKSPILFESQPCTNIFENQDLYKKSEISKTDVHEPTNESKISIDTDLSKLLDVNVPVVEHNGVDGKESSCISLKPMSNFQVPDNEHVQSICCDEKIIDDIKQFYMICLCSTCLKLYIYNDDMWKCLTSIKIPFTIRKKSGNVLHRLNDTETVNVVLLEPKTNSTIIHCYSYIDNAWKQTQIDKIFCKSLNICPLPNMKIVISYIAGKKTYIDKYSMDEINREWSHDQIASIDVNVLQLLLVKGIQSALVILTEFLQIQIWNHEHGLLLTTVDISDVSPIKPQCTHVFSEQGYLFLPMLSEKKGIQAGSVIVINPYLGTSETLVPINCHHTWTGTNKVYMLTDDLIVCQQNNGYIRIWNVHSGYLVTTINDVTSSTFYCNNKFLVLAHKQCVHPFYLNVPCEL